MVVWPMLEKNTLLNEDIPLAEGTGFLCKAGLQALSYLDGSAKPDTGWKARTLPAVQQAGKRQSNMRNLIEPAIEKLVEAVPGI
jgi:hypothetical protein